MHLSLCTKGERLASTLGRETDCTEALTNSYIRTDRLVLCCSSNGWCAQHELIRMINTHDGGGQFHQEFVKFRLTIWIRTDGADCAHGAKAISVWRTADGIADPERKFVVGGNGTPIASHVGFTSGGLKCGIRSRNH
jgi:hypothetical protein